MQDTVAVAVDTAKAVVDSTFVSTSNSLALVGGGIFLAIVVAVVFYMKFKDKGGKVVLPK